MYGEIIELLYLIMKMNKKIIILSCVFVLNPIKMKIESNLFLVDKMVKLTPGHVVYKKV